MKKLKTILASLLMIGALTGCSSNTTTNNNITIESCTLELSTHDYNDESKAQYIYDLSEDLEEYQDIDLFYSVVAVGRLYNENNSYTSMITIGTDIPFINDYQTFFMIGVENDNISYTAQLTHLEIYYEEEENYPIIVSEYNTTISDFDNLLLDYYIAD